MKLIIDFAELGEKELKSLIVWLKKTTKEGSTEIKSIDRSIDEEGDEDDEDWKTKRNIPNILCMGKPRTNTNKQRGKGIIMKEQSKKIINSMKTKCEYLSRDLEKLEKTLEEEKIKWN